MKKVGDSFVEGKYKKENRAKCTLWMISPLPQ